jgi:hypothetical protein
MPANTTKTTPTGTISPNEAKTNPRAKTSPPQQSRPETALPVKEFDLAREISGLKSRILAVEESSIMTEVENSRLTTQISELSQELELEKAKHAVFEQWAKGQLELVGVRVPALEGRLEMAGKRVGAVERRVDTLTKSVKGGFASLRAGSRSLDDPPSIPPPPPLDLPEGLEGTAAVQVQRASGLKRKVEEDVDVDEHVVKKEKDE